MSEKKPILQFQDDAEYLKWALETLSKAVENLSKRQAIIEQAIQKMPPPGPDMIQYKIPGDEEYSNIKGVLDNIFDRLNKLETE
tara:strand:+ start:683 stop:934 length:252 start_codon:yes stop_codon:yes gene_type:complete